MQQLSLNLEFIIILKSRTHNKLWAFYFFCFLAGSFAWWVVFFWGVGVVGFFGVAFFVYLLFGVFLFVFIDSARPERGRTEKQKEKEELKFSEPTGESMYIICHNVSRFCAMRTLCHQRLTLCLRET